MIHTLRILWSWIDGMSNQDILSFITSHFSKDIINALDTSMIITNNSVVHMDTDFEPILYTKEVFKKKFDDLPEDQKIPLLNRVIVGINYGDTIKLYNQDFVFELYSILRWKSLDEAELKYLEWIPYNIIPQIYKLWIISHELWHSIHDLYVKNTVLQDNWMDITDEFWPMTKYVTAYDESDDLFYEENFTESLKIYTTNSSYLMKYYPKVHKFIKDNFPYIYE